MISVQVNGLEQLLKLADNLELKLSNVALMTQTLKIAEAAGVILHKASVQACIDAVYDATRAPSVYDDGVFRASSTMDEDRTGALLDSHILVNHGLEQIVQIDEDYAVPTNDHSGREMVIDYAVPVHEGYTQFVPDGHGGSVDTGEFHPGRFWFNVASIESAPVILEFISLAFFGMVESALVQAVA